MTSSRAILDTDIVSAIMRKRPVALVRAQAYLAAFDQFTFSIITRYEILRGIRAKGATAQAVAFDQFCAVNRILQITDDVVVRAAEIYGDLYRRGILIGDADILIAASAQVHGLTMVTGNEEHFRRITGLNVENWLRE